MDRKTTAARLQELMEESRMKQTDILEAAIKYAKVYGIKMNRSDISQYVNGKVVPSQEKLTVLSKALGVSEPWLMGYDVPRDMSTHISLGTSSQDSDRAWGEPLLDAYAASPTPTQKIVCRVLEIPTVVPGEVPEGLEVSHDCVSESQQPAAAGTGIYLGPEEFVIRHVKKGCLPRNTAFTVPVSGDSMEPKFHDGDILIVGEEKASRDGQIGIFTMDGMGYVKRVKGGYLESLNKKYDDIPMTEDIICNGLVIGVLDKDCILEEE